MTDEPSSDADGADGADVAAETVRGMVRHLEPSWRVDAIDRSAHGTDFVAVLDVRTADRDEDGDEPRTVVLKAMTAEWVDPETFRAEPRLLSLLDRETTIPVPSVIGSCDDHDEYPAPFYLMEYVSGENYEGRPHQLAPPARERILREAGRNLARLHDLGPLPAVGGIGVRDRDGDLTVLAPRSESFHDWLLESYEDTLDSLAEGGYFPDLADDRDRFADLVPELRRYLRETIPELPAPDPPTYCNKDYRYGNLLVDPETGATRAVIDWGNVMAAAPAFNIASAESLLLTPDADDSERTAALRRAFRTAYADARDDWTFDEAARERLRVYRLACRLDAMACLPLWYRDASPAERDERAAEHRAFVAQYL